MKFNVIHFFILIITTFIGINCSNNETYTNIESYYFPVNQLNDGGRVYEYALIGDTNGVAAFFKYESFKQKDKVTLVCTQFSDYCIQGAIYRDEIVHNGALREGIRIIEYDETLDTTFFTDLEIVSPNVFPFEVKDSSRFLYKVIAQPKVDTTSTITIQQKMMYLGKTVHSFNGKNYDAVDFSVEEERTEQSIDGDFHTAYVTKRRYAQGLGLVYYTERIGDKDFQFRLTNVMTMDEFTKDCEQMIYNDY